MYLNASVPQVQELAFEYRWTEIVHSIKKRSLWGESFIMQLNVGPEPQAAKNRTAGDLCVGLRVCVFVLWVACMLVASGSG